MASIVKPAKVKTSQNKVIELKQQGNIAFQLLVKSQNSESQISLEKVMSFQLTPFHTALAIQMDTSTRQIKHWA